MSPFFGPKIGEDKKKSFRRKSSGFLVQMRLETKQNERSSPQISGVMVLDPPPPNDATTGRTEKISPKG